jgi:Interferon-induced transmembrane protein
MARPDNSDAPEPVVPRAPTHRGELAQRAAGIVPTVLAHPNPPRPKVEIPGPVAPPVWPPPPSGDVAPTENAPAVDPAAPVGAVGETGPGAPAPAPAQTLAWPPPPAAWDPAVAATWNPPPAPAQAPGQWAPPSPGAAPVWAPPRQRGWDRPRIGSRRRDSRSEAYAGAPPSYFWQSIASLILLPPMGLVAVIWSLLVSRRSQAGDRAGATRASLQARIWCMATLVVFAGVAVISAVLGFGT